MKLTKHQHFYYDVIISALAFAAFILRIIDLSEGLRTWQQMFDQGILAVFYRLRKSVLDGIWWAFVRATTVGYGDISPGTLYGRIIAMVFMLVGIGLISTVTSTITLYFLNAGHKKNVTDEMIKRKRDDFDSLTEEDIEAICGVLKKKE